jgi:hypothetical protein
MSDNQDFDKENIEPDFAGDAIQETPEPETEDRPIDELPPPSQTQPIQGRPNNFIEKIFEIITGFTNDERIKQRKLKDISKKLRHLKLKFYNFKKDQVLQPLGEYFYEIYRLSQNLSKFMDTKKHSKSIKQMLFEIFSSEAQKKLRLELERDNIDKMVRASSNPKEAIATIKNNIKEYIKSFDAETVKKINNTYNQMADLSNIVTFDWFFLVHKFDSEITDTNFNYKPDFEIIEGKYVIDELITLNDYLETIDFNKDWKNVLEYLKAVSDDEGLLNILRRILKYCKTLKQDNYLLHMIRLIQKDPFFKSQTFSNSAKIVQDYIYNFQVELQAIVNNALKDLKKAKIDKLLMDIFHKTAIVRLKNYSDKTNELLEKKGIIGFLHIEPINYLKAFLLDFCKGEIKPRIDALIIKGTWSTHTASSEYSSLLDQFNKLSDKIIEFDDSCSEEETYGRTIRKLIFAVKHDPNAKQLLKKTIYKVDSDAYQIIIAGINLFALTNKKIKELIDDYNSKSPSIIVDINKIRWDFQDEYAVEMSDILRKTNNFIALLKNFIKASVEQAKKADEE